MIFPSPSFCTALYSRHSFLHQARMVPSLSESDIEWSHKHRCGNDERAPSPRQGMKERALD